MQDFLKEKNLCCHFVNIYKKFIMKFVANLLKNFIPYFEKKLPSQNMKIFKNICGEIWSEKLGCMEGILDDRDEKKRF